MAFPPFPLIILFSKSSSVFIPFYSIYIQILTFRSFLTGSKAKSKVVQKKGKLDNH